MQDRKSEPVSLFLGVKKIIPEYQRDFVWTTNELSSFFDDLLEAFTEPKKKKENQYFIGSMVFEKTNNNKEFIIVDGQQRVTSVFILISLATNILIERNYENDTMTYYKSFYLRGDGGPKDCNLISEESTEISEIFNEIVTHGVKEINHSNNNIAINSIKKAADTFNTLLEGNFLDNVNENKILHDFIKFILNNVTFSYYTSENRMDSLIVYERLNSSGKPLSELEIAKGTLFVEVENDETEWNKLSSEWSKLIELINEAKIKKDKFFLRHYIAVNHKDDIIKGNEFKGDGLLNTKDIIKFITKKRGPFRSNPILTCQNLIEFTKKLKNINNGCDIFGDPNIAIKNIAFISNSKTHNIILLQARDKEVFQAAALVSLAQTTINKLLGRYLGGTEKRFEKWAKLIHEKYNDNCSPKEISKYLAKEALQTFYDDWKEVEPKFEQFDYNSGDRALLVLKMTECVLDKKTSNNGLSDGIATPALNNVTIDHIEPQNSVNFEKFGGNGLGNLALLQKSPNSAIQDKLLESAIKQNAYRNSNFYSTKFQITNDAGYGGKEGETYKKFPHCKSWTVETYHNRLDMIKTEVREFALSELEQLRA